MLPGNERSDIEAGGKIIMPPSALDQLTRLNITYPMLFKLSNRVKTHENSLLQIKPFGSWFIFDVSIYYINISYLIVLI